MASGCDYADLIGKPFRHGAQGPDDYDCFGLVREILRRRGIDVPEYSVRPGATGVARALAGLKDWDKVIEAPGVVALFKLTSTLHVGYILPFGRMIHTWEQSGGVCVERFEPWRAKLLGCYVYRNC